VAGDRGVPARTESDPWFEEVRATPKSVSIALAAGEEGVLHRRLDRPDEMDRMETMWLVEDHFDRPPVPTVVKFAPDRFGEGASIRFSVTRGGAPDPDEVERLLQPYLASNQASGMVTVAALESHELPGFELAVELEWKWPDGATLADAWRIGNDAEALLAAVEDEEISHAVAVHLIRAGRWGLFKGRPESDWLEAKQVPYGQAKDDGETWKYELAKDVAAFANSPAGGLIIIGMSTKDQGDGDVITGYIQFDLKQVTANTYGNFIAQHVHPRVAGFEVVRVAGSEPTRGIAALVIPPQDPADLPFLVRGTINDGAVLGHHVLWPVRQGDRTALLDIDGIHARLRLGDQVIKG
jgi:hypothetical protein